MSGVAPFLLPRAGETDEEARLREALNRHAGAMLATLDAAMALRTAPPEAQKARHTVRHALKDACLRAMDAHLQARRPA